MRNLVTESLIWYLGLSVGIPSITEKNWEEVAWRVALIEKVSGTTMYKYVKGQGKVDIPVTKEDVQRHIGLSTNGERMTKAQFFKRLTTRLDIPTDEDVAIIEKKVDEDRAKVA
jgi:hypothetical protein